jgi:hypothetical protein
MDVPSQTWFAKAAVTPAANEAPRPEAARPSKAARRARILPCAAVVLGLLLLLSGLFARPRPSQAMPTFAQAYGIPCSRCHTIVPLLNSYGRYVQNTGYAALDRHVLARSLPIWLEEDAAFDSTNDPGSGPGASPRIALGNLAVHATGYLAQDVTYHFQEWAWDGNYGGHVDTFWASYNNLLHRNGHLFVGLIQNPQPSPYSETFDIDGVTASGTFVGEHDWSATYSNRWGSKFAYVTKSLDAEAGYFFGNGDFGGAAGATDFGSLDKTFQYKVAYAHPNVPIEVGVFGSVGTVPVSTGNGIDSYNSQAVYVELDPSTNYRPGLLLVGQDEHDGNPGMGSNGPLTATGSQGVSAEIFESLFHGAVVVSAQHNFNNAGFGQMTNGNAFNVGFNFPHFQFLHGYIEALTGGESALSGISGGPEWKGVLIFALPIRSVR